MPIVSIPSLSFLVAGLAAVFFGAGSAVSPPPLGAARDISVGSTPQLIAALKQARGGQRILLAPGIYPPFSVRGIAPAGRVEIVSRDPKRRAVMTGMNMRGGGNLVFRNLVFQSAGTAVQEDFLFQGVRNLAFVGLIASGRPGRIGLQTDKILLLRECTDVSVTRSDFTNALIALSLLDSQGVTVTSNHFHDLRMDGIRGGGNSSVLIAYNYITGFSPQGADHPDAIQFWTSRQKNAAHDITILGNVILRGRGKAMQGIFIRDENGSLPYRNVRIEDNLVAGTMFNGIAVLSESESLTLKGNVVSAFPDQKSWIRVGSKAVLEGNSAPIYLVGKQRVRALPNNQIMPARDDGGAAALKRWARGRALDRYAPSLRRHVEGV
ncbi:right-handed parallel beta-helix repeat-containing protein [Sphingomonas jeddahensis]|uniref:Right handed beta helix domain-containing protein n=1 Tax=Sphingomonas jeddahensis TaxID=1915074 RepID=A0A1V2EUH3_9SPHN|nr:right-handed parallel beta-helix repeat-containing protein [Sphingomonas jeddahensis]ONF96203.1 hypothetical protein SPHI_14320 [Sphingomonas jeddahensis]